MNPRMILFLAASGLCCALTSADLPQRKAGLWEITMSPPNPKFPPTVERVCLDAATNALLYKAGAGAGKKLCSKTDVQSSGGKVVVDSVCKIGSTQATTHSVTILSGATGYHTDTAVHYDPPMFGRSESTSSQDGKWSGECPADMKPGDIVVNPSPMMPVPLKMNLNDMLKAGD